MKETLGLQQYATANDVMEMLVEKNDLQDFFAGVATCAGRHPLRDGSAGVLQCE